MKRINILRLLGAGLIALVFTSCSNRVFPVEKLEMNYNSRMTSISDREIKSSIPIFYKEADVPGEYEILSVNRYSPWFAIPLIYPVDRQIERKFLENAARTTYKQGGDGIVVMAGGFYKVFVLKDKSKGNVDIPKSTNIISDMTIANVFAQGKVSTMERSVRNRYIDSFKDEIASNIKYAKTQQDLDIIKNKVSIFEQYNKSLKKPDSDIEDDIASFRKKIKKAEEKLSKKAK